MKNKKNYLLTFLLCSILILGFGCKGLSQEEKASIKPVTLNYWTVFGDTKTLQSLADEYRVKHPHVKINIKKVREDEFEDLLVNALADDVGPDIASIHVRDLKKYQSRLLPAPEQVQVSNVYIKGEYSKETIVTPEINKIASPLAIKSNFVSTVYDDVVLGGKVWGIPLSVDVMGMYYNKPLLDQAGIALPPQTWEEFMEAVKSTTVFDEDGNIIQSGVALGTGKNIARSFDILSMLMMQSGVEIAQGRAITMTSGLKANNENHPTLRALNFYTDFARPTKEVYTWNEDQEDALTNFSRGKSAFYFGFAYDYSRIKGVAPQMELEITAVPQLNPSKPINIANYYMESVVKKTKNPNEAWDFVRFITSPDNIKKYTQATRRPTPLRAQVKDQQEDTVLSAFALTVLQAENWYHGRDRQKAEEVFWDLIYEYIQPYSGKDSEIKHAVDLINKYASIIQQTM